MADGTKTIGEELWLRIDAAFDVFACFRTELVALLREVRAGETARAKKLAPAVAEIGRALAAILKEVEKVDALKAHWGGGDHSAALDLGDARSEVGRRLDRLRAAACPDGISGGAQPA